MEYIPHKPCLAAICANPKPVAMGLKYTNNPEPVCHNNIPNTSLLRTL